MNHTHNFTDIVLSNGENATYGEITIAFEEFMDGNRHLPNDYDRIMQLQELFYLNIAKKYLLTFNMLRIRLRKVRDESSFFVFINSITQEAIHILLNETFIHRRENELRAGYIGSAGTVCLKESPESRELPEKRSVQNNGKGCLAGCRQPLDVDYDCSASANILHAAYFAGFGRVEGNVIILCHPLPLGADGIIIRTKDIIITGRPPP